MASLEIQFGDVLVSKNHTSRQYLITDVLTDADKDFFEIRRILAINTDKEWLGGAGTGAAEDIKSIIDRWDLSRVLVAAERGFRYLIPTVTDQVLNKLLDYTREASTRRGRILP